jgi:hypothetical protein
MNTNYYIHPSTRYFLSFPFSTVDPNRDSEHLDLVRAPRSMPVSICQVLFTHTFHPDFFWEGFFPYDLFFFLGVGL